MTAHRGIKGPYAKADIQCPLCGRKTQPTFAFDPLVLTKLYCPHCDHTVDLAARAKKRHHR